MNPFIFAVCGILIAAGFLIPGLSSKRSPTQRLLCLVVANLLLLGVGAGCVWMLVHADRNPSLHLLIANHRNAELRSALQNGSSANAVVLEKPALDLAVQKRNHQALEILLQHGASIRHQETGGNRPTVFLAAMIGDPEAVAILFRHGGQADVTFQGQTAAFHAFQARDYATLSSLIQAGANPDVRDSDGTPAWFLSAVDQNAEQLKGIAEIGLRFPNQDSQGRDLEAYAKHRGRVLTVPVREALARIRRNDKFTSGPH